MEGQTLYDRQAGPGIALGTVGALVAGALGLLAWYFLIKIMKLTLKHTVPL